VLSLHLNQSETGKRMCNPMTDGSTRAAILLVDSDSMMRAVLQDALQGAGYLVIAAEDLGVAVDRLKNVCPDLLVIRPYIDSMTGQVAADYLRSRCPGLPVLVVAGLIDDDRISVENEIKKLHTFPKAFSTNELLAKVADVLKSESEKHTSSVRT